LFEIKRKLLREKYEQKKIENTLRFIKERSIILEIDAELLEKAADVSVQHKLPAIDSMIYTLAQQQNTILITGDNDFRNCPNVKIID
jgi:PIN domain nuclease of toxin-antitoxin system